MGINVGDIIIEDGDIFGDGVNIAAGLEALAVPGGICLSAAAHEQVHYSLLPYGPRNQDLGVYNSPCCRWRSESRLWQSTLCPR